MPHPLGVGCPIQHMGDAMTQTALARWDTLMAERTARLGAAPEVPTPATDALADIRAGLDLIRRGLVAIGAPAPGTITLGELSELLSLAAVTGSAPGSPGRKVFRENSRIAADKQFAAAYI